MHIKLKWDGVYSKGRERANTTQPLAMASGSTLQPANVSKVAVHALLSAAVEVPLPLPCGV